MTIFCNTMLTLHKYKTEKNADSVEFCPHTPNQNIFVCANYQLTDKEDENATSKRSGLLLLFSITTKNNLQLLQSLDCIGVLDTKWCHNKVKNRSLLAVANAEKSIEVYELTSEIKLKLFTKITIKSDYEEVLILSLDWSTGRDASEEPGIICSDSKGFVHKLIFENDQLFYVNGYKVHDFECWIAAYNYFNTNVFYSGGDDAKFLTHDNRVGNFAVFTNKSHEAGVTSIHSNSKYENVLATGSYDSFLRLWDARTVKDCLFKLELPGSLWRLKWDPFQSDYLLTACMMGGAHIIELIDKSNCKITRSYNEHKSLVYGIDWCYLSQEKVKEYSDNAQYLIGSCSFYDNLLCLSTFNYDKNSE